MPVFRGRVLPAAGLLAFVLILWGTGRGFSDTAASRLPGESRPEPLAYDTAGSACRNPQEGAGTEPPNGEPFVYDLKFRLEVEGRIKLLHRTRYCRSEDLRLKLAARPSPEGLAFRSLGLVEDEGDTHFGIGEGPRRHQRYILLATQPSEQEKALLRQRVERLQTIRGCGLDSSPPAEGTQGHGPAGKQGYFNYYLWSNPVGTFGFLLSPGGEYLAVRNHVVLDVLSREGGRRANPLFFEILEYALLAVSAFTEASWASQGGQVPDRWEMDCRDIMQGLVRFSKQVYGREMTLLDTERLERRRILYTAHRVSGSRLFRVRGTLSRTECTPIRVSGFRGRIWIESFSRETYLDAGRGRILKDEVEVSFGVERDKKLFFLSGTKNFVRISLMDDCLLQCPDTEEAILMAHRRCMPALPDPY